MPGFTTHDVFVPCTLDHHLDKILSLIRTRRVTHPVRVMTLNTAVVSRSYLCLVAFDLENDRFRKVVVVITIL